MKKTTQKNNNSLTKEKFLRLAKDFSKEICSLDSLERIYLSNPILAIRLDTFIICFFNSFLHLKIFFVRNLVDNLILVRDYENVVKTILLILEN